VSSQALAPSPAVARTGPRISARAVMLLMVVLVVLTLSIAPVRAYLDERSRLADLEHQATQLEQRNAQLETTIRALKDPAELERVARRCLGMVRPGELAFVTVPQHGRKDGVPVSSDC
jgi:cell division protein FtsB